MPEEPNQEPASSVSPEKKAGKKSKLSGPELERAISPRPSVWPFGLAFALIFTFAGLIIHPVVLGIGVVLVVVAIIGWALERRR